MDIKSGAITAFPSSLEDAKTESREALRPQKWWRLGGNDAGFVSVDADCQLDPATPSNDLSDGSRVVKNVNNVYEAPEAVELYKPIEGFEGAHRFHPSATWTQAEEKALVRKVRIANAIQYSPCLTTVPA